MPPKPSPTMPAIVTAANAILDVEIAAYRQLDNGGVVVITGQGQKFTLTAEQLSNPNATKTQLKKDKVKVFKQLPHGPIRLPNPPNNED